MELPFVDYYREMQLRETGYKGPPPGIFRPRNTRKMALLRAISDYGAGIVLCALHVSLFTIYSVILTYNVSEDPKYQAFCDLGPVMRCTKLFRSEYGFAFGFGGLFGKDSVFNVPNGLYELTFFLVIILANFYKTELAARLQLITLIITNGLSIYLSYVLYHELQIFSPLCAIVYFLNLGMIFMSLMRHEFIMKYHELCTGPSKAPPHNARQPNSSTQREERAEPSTTSSTAPDANDVNENDNDPVEQQQQQQQQQPIPIELMQFRKNARRRYKRN